MIIGSLCAQTNETDLQQRILLARDKVMPALVNVEPVKSYFTTGERRHTLVTGSGFIFSPKGYVLTNNHVVENAEKVHCTLFNKKKVSAKVVGNDPSTDVAVLQLNMDEWGADPLPYAKLGNSDSAQVGDIVLALGSPLGLSRSVSMGVISSIDRYFEDAGQMISPYNLWIQTDAAINPGNSGGPLINLSGEVVGMNARGVFLAENLGFAIPINLAREIADKLLTGEKLERGWIGVDFQPVKDLRDYLGQPDLQGVLVANTEPLSPALKAGIQAGDVITSLGGQRVNAEYEENLPAIRKIIADLLPGTTVDIGIWRKGKTKTIQVRVQLEPFRDHPEFECTDWGMVTKSLSRNIFQLQHLPDYNGVFISAVKNGELADQSGIKAGDVIRSVNHQPVKDLPDFQKLYEKLVSQKEKFVYFELWRDGATSFAAMSTRSKKE